MIEGKLKQQVPLSLRRNFSWTFIGNIIYAGCQWGMLVLLTKIVSPEMVGQFTLGLAINTPIFMFTNLQLRQIQATDAKGKYLFADYLGLRIVCVSSAVILLTIIILNTEHQQDTSLVILLVGLAKAVDALSDIFYGLFQQHERMDRMAKSMILKGLLSLFMLGIGVYLTDSVVGGVVGLIIAWALILVVYDFRSGALILNQNLPPSQTTSKILLPRLQARTLASLAWLALPMGLVMMLISLGDNMPRYFIEQYLGVRELGIFSTIAYLMITGDMVVLALGQSAIPRLAKYYAEVNSNAFRGLLLKLVGIGALLGTTAILIALIAGKQILTLIYRPEYGQYASLLVWLMVAAAIKYMSSFLGQGMTAARFFRVQMPLSALVAITSGIACIWLLPTYGLFGAAIAILCAAIVQLLVSLGIVIYAIYRLKQSTAK